MLALTFAPCVLTFAPCTLTFAPCAYGVSLLSIYLYIHTFLILLHLMHERLDAYLSIQMHIHSTQVPVDCWLLLVREYIEQFMIVLPNNKHTMYS